MNTSFDDSSICQANIFTQDQVDYRLMVNLPVSLFGMITNLLNVIVFTQSEMRTSLVNHFLLAISISDLLLLICNFFFLIFPVLSWMSKSFILNDTYPVVLRFCYPLARIAQTCGVYLTLFVSVHRFLGVCYPFRAKRWITATPVAYAICGAVLFSVLINVTTWIELCVVPCYSKQFNRTTRQIQMTAISQEYMYGLVVRVIAYTTFMFVVPFVTLIIVNVRIMMALHDSSRLRQRNSQRQGAIPKNILRRPNIVKATNSVRERSVTIMLLVIVAIFLGCNGLPFCNNIVEILIFVDKIDGTSSASTFEISVEIGNILVSLNSASSILVYLIFSSKYREGLKHCIGLEKDRKVNGVALTAALAAHKAFELSILPDEAGRHGVKEVESTTALLGKNIDDEASITTNSIRSVDGEGRKQLSNSVENRSGRRESRPNQNV